MDGTLTKSDIRNIPTNLSFERAWRWCILVTIRDLRLSAARQRTISLPNMKRLFLRRFHDVCNLDGVADEAGSRVRRTNQAIAFLNENYKRQVASCRFTDETGNQGGT